MAPTPRLEVDKITCRFDGRDVVRDVSFTVRAGEVMCLLGPSGCGKSTTLRVIAGIERQVSGAVRADGATLSDDKIHLPPEARGVGLIFQDFALFPHLSVGQNVAFGLKASRPDVARRVGELLERVDLAGYADKAPHMLSGGEQQRVALARALAPRMPRRTPRHTCKGPLRRPIGPGRRGLTTPSARDLQPSASCPTNTLQGWTH